MAAFAASHIAASATVVTDGLWCFGAVTLVGAEHKRIVTDEDKRNPSGHKHRNDVAFDSNNC